MMERSDPTTSTCGAKTRYGGTCKNPPITGRSRCRMHGGTQKCGPASPNYKTGRYSKVISGTLLEHYHDALQDRELLSLREDIALVEADKKELLERQQAGEASGCWRRLQQAKRSLEKSRAIADKEERDSKIRYYMGVILTIIEEGATDTEKLQDRAAIDARKTKLIAQEQKRLVLMQQMVTMEQMTAIIHAMIAIARRNVPDPDVRARMADEIAGLLQTDTFERPHIIEAA